MLNERWITLLIFIGLLGLVWRVPALAAVGLISLVVLVASYAFRLVALKGIRYSRRLNETRVFMGEPVDVACRLENDSRLPALSLHVRDDSPRGFVEAQELSEHDVAPLAETLEEDATGRVNLSQTAALKPRAQITRAFHLRATRRGYHVFAEPRVRAADLLGISEVDRVEPLRDKVLVYPRVFALEELGLPARQPLGAIASLRRLIEDPTRNMGARDYQPGDPFRHIHWKATAHRGALQTRVFEHTAEPTSTVLLNVTTFENDWVGVDVERFEWAIAVAASIASWLHENGCTVGVSTNGCTPEVPDAIRVKPRRSPDQLTHVLETLAMLHPFTAMRFNEFVLHEMRHIPQGSSLIVVTPLLTEAIDIALRRLHDLGRRMLVVCADRAAPDLGALPFDAVHVPPTQDFTQVTGLAHMDARGAPRRAGAQTGSGR